MQKKILLLKQATLPDSFQDLFMIFLLKTLYLFTAQFVSHTSFHKIYQHVSLPASSPLSTFGHPSAIVRRLA